ncbi:MAG: hypothetical protein U5K56_18140 [Halioglobus sp.]|nr:hypothetical protein [Halioglobus sp.]
MSYHREWLKMQLEQVLVDAAGPNFRQPVHWIPPIGNNSFEQHFGLRPEQPVRGLVPRVAT